MTRAGAGSRWRARRRRTDADMSGASDPLFGSGIVFQMGWARHHTAVAEASFAQLARRLPQLIRICLGLGWRADRRALLAMLVFQSATGIATAFGLLATNQILIRLLSAGPSPARARAALPSLILVGVAAAGGALLSAAGSAASGRLRPKVTRHAFTELMTRATSVELSVFELGSFHDTLEGASFGAGWAEYVIEQITQLITAVAAMAAAASVLVVLGPFLLPLLILAALPGGVASMMSYRRRNRSRIAWQGRARQQRRLADLMTEKQPAQEIRLHGVDRFLHAHYARLSAAYEGEQERLARADARTTLTAGSVSGTALACCYLLLGYLLWRGVVPLATAGTATFAIRTGTAQIRSAIGTVNQIFEYGLYLADWQDAIAQADAAAITGQGLVPAGPPTTISLRGVSFTYPGRESPAIAGIDLDLQSGQVIALVGENGSGKSTLAKLILGLYLPTEGEVYWDGMATSAMDRTRAGTHVGVLAQDYPCWPFVAEANIQIGRPDLEDPQRVRDAAVASGADAVIEKLGDGYRSLLASEFQGGTNLSGGQWQKIANARAAYRAPAWAVYDEPTAALDPRAEAEAFNRVLDRADGRTVVLITHRLSSVARADRIIVLKDGRVVESGSHKELMGADGEYRLLYMLQASQFGAASYAAGPALDESARAAT
ncbi:ATP-binding cassette domain-containing protein [Actinospica robiniae]|uniref:ATP-binding cassette domain-containing protein n=1 Tax=Actinospica robiniae TaxID=304901 RepID=UPI000423C1FA|nr:ATP-binding cassette domain-containing protein [Actinospica robiniae]